MLLNCGVGKDSSPLDCKEIQPVNPKENQSWIFIGRADAKVETPIFWPPDVRTDSLEKTLMLGKIEGSRKRGRKGEWLDGITDSMDMSLTKLWVLVKVRETWHSAVHGVAQNELNSSKQHRGAKSAKFCQLQKFSWGWLPWIYWGTITIISLYSACMTDQLMKLQSPRLKASTHYYILTTSDMQMIPNSRKWRGTKEPLDEGRKWEWKSWLKTQHSKTKIMASNPIISWQINGKKWKHWQILFSWAPKSLGTVTAAMKLKDICFMGGKLWQT